MRAPNSPHRHPPSSLRDPRFSYVQAKPHRPYTVRIWTCHSASASKQAGRQARQASPSRQPAGTRSRRSSGSGRSIILPFIHHSTSHQPRIASAGGRSSSTYVAAASRHPAGRSRVGPSTYTPAASPASFLPCLPCVLPSIFGRRGRRSGTMKRSERVRLSQMCRLYR